MRFRTAVVGAGRMGSIVAGQVPREIDLTVIDTDAARAAEIAGQTRADRSGADMALAGDADIILLVLPAPVIPAAAEQAATAAKPGALIVDMATKGCFPEGIAGKYPAVRLRKPRSSATPPPCVKVPPAA